MDYVLYDASAVLPGPVAQLVVRRGYKFGPDRPSPILKLRLIMKYFVQ